MFRNTTMKLLGLLIPSVIVILLAVPASAQWAGTWVSSVQVMNLGTATANVVVEYYQENGTRVEAATRSYTITIGSSLNIYQPSVPNLPEGFKGSAIVSADQPIAAIGSEQTTYPDGSIGNSQYSGFSAETVGIKFYLPNVNKKFGGSQWSTRITIQNVTANPVTATITFYNADATVRDTDVVNLPGNGSTTLTQINDTELPDGWLGSAIVDATGNIAVIVDIMSADGRLETYNGFTSGATTLYLPTLLIGLGANQWNTSFQVLNVGSATAVVTMTYYTAGVATPSKVVTTNLPQYQSINRYQPSVDSDLGTPWIGSVVIESTQPIVAVGTQSSGAPGKRLASAYNGVASGATQAFLPTVLRFFGGSNFVTSFQIMNVGAGPASVTVEYFAPGNPTPIMTVRYDGVENPKIARYTSVNRYQGNDTALGSGWQGSVRVTSDQPVVVLGSQNGLNRTGDAAGQYNGIVAAP
ncbi:hypothetical protein [Thermanaerothrix sp.]|uniref:hypothetical protein n=1 Tax=Thermanaerothrix sp. TaxID=2972675 RepID=UPI003C7BC4CB